MRAIKIRVTTTAVMVVLLVVAYGVFQTLRDEFQDHAVFTITFSPEPRKQGVHVKGVVEGVEFYNELVSRGPVMADTWIPKGAEASVFAQQMTSGALACTAHLNGKLVDGPNPRTEIGSVRCYVNRRIVP